MDVRQPHCSNRHTTPLQHDHNPQQGSTQGPCAGHHSLCAEHLQLSGCCYPCAALLLAAASESAGCCPTAAISSPLSRCYCTPGTAAAAAACLSAGVPSRLAATSMAAASAVAAAAHPAMPELLEATLYHVASLTTPLLPGRPDPNGGQARPIDAAGDGRGDVILACVHAACAEAALWAVPACVGTAAVGPSCAACGTSTRQGPTNKKVRA